MPMRHEVRYTRTLASPRQFPIPNSQFPTTSNAQIPTLPTEHALGVGNWEWLAVGSWELGVVSDQSRTPSTNHCSVSRARKRRYVAPSVKVTSHSSRSQPSLSLLRHH